MHLRKKKSYNIFNDEKSHQDIVNHFHSQHSLWILLWGARLLIGLKFWKSAEDEGKRGNQDDAKRSKGHGLEERRPNQIVKESSAQCLKITEKVSFNIASEASYVYILSVQEMPKMVHFGEFLKT